MSFPSVCLCFVRALSYFLLCLTHTPNYDYILRSERQTRVLAAITYSRDSMNRITENGNDGNDGNHQFEKFGSIKKLT